MDQFSQPNPVLDKKPSVLRKIASSIRRFFSVLGRGLSRLGGWLRLHVPFVEAIVKRNVANPANIFTDFAIAILFLYILFGALGAFLVYKQHSESSFTETLALVYPMPAARVDNNVIWAHQFLVRVRYINSFNQQTNGNSGTQALSQDQIRQQVLDGLVQNQILVNEAKKHSVSVSAQEVSAAYDAQKKDTPDLDAQIKKLYDMSPTDFKSIIAEQILRQKVEAAVVQEVSVSHILTTTADAANQAETDIKNGMSFSDAAKKYSQDAQSKDSGGVLGNWSKGELATQVAQNFEDTAFSLTVGQVSTPIQTKYGYHIITITAKNGTNYQSFDDWYDTASKSYKSKEYLR